MPSKSKRIKPSRPLLEVDPVLHHRLKGSASVAGMPLKDFTHHLLTNNLSRWEAGALRIEPAKVVEAETQTTLPL